jgi:hypothetical protein
MIFLIDLKKETAYQTFTMVLSGSPFRFYVLWNEIFQYWSMSIEDSAGNSLLKNVKMVQNYPLTEMYLDDRLPRGDFVLLNTETLRPAFSSFGENCSLYFSEKNAI